MDAAPARCPFRHGQIAGGYLKRKLGHWLVQADSLGQHAVKHIHIEEILAFAQQAGVKLKLGGIQLAGHGGAQVDRVGNAHGGRIPEMQVQL